MRILLRLLFIALATGGLLALLLPAALAAPPQAPPTPTVTPLTSGGGRAPAYYIVEAGDTLFALSRRFGLPVSTLLEVNQLEESAPLRVGQQLIIPGSDSSLPDPNDAPLPPTRERGDVIARMTSTARRAAPNSPFHKTTWVTYYGRPNVPIMGILGEFSIDELVPRLREQAEAYDEANGPELGVMPAFHLVYGMATKMPGDDGSHLTFLRDEVVMEYIERAQVEGFGVILDIQIGKLDPAESLKRGLPFLKYENVHLALDPEFAMSHPGQERPGKPIGFVTAEQLNRAQALMRSYMKENRILGRRILIVHQFLDTMIVNKEDLDRVYKIDLTITADGFGGPWPKIGKYNSFITDEVKFAGFKLFYRWDEPLLTEREVLGIDRHPGISYIDFTPNLIIYQ